MRVKSSETGKVSRMDETHAFAHRRFFGNACKHAIGKALAALVMAAGIGLICSTPLAASLSVPGSNITEVSAATAKESNRTGKTASAADGTLSVHFIDVGQGDATLLVCDGHALLIDAGNNNRGTAVQLYLKKQNVKSLDAVIWTHPDADHIGGADVITTKFDIGTTYMTSVSSDTKTYQDLIDAIDYRGYEITAPKVGESFSLGDAKVMFLGPTRTYSDDNDNSIACMVTYGDTKFLFTGDAEEDAEADLVSYAKKHRMDLSADVYKAGHHGSRTASSEKLMNAVEPTYAVISCKEGNSYGHPHAEVMNRLRSMDVQVYRTDEQGSLIATSDGTEITWNAAPSETWQAGEPTGGSASSASGKNTAYKKTTAKASASTSGTVTGTAAYVGNTRNAKLHKASCSKLPNANNQRLFDTLDDAKAAGYTQEKQCQSCKPYGNVTQTAKSKASTTKSSSTGTTAKAAAAAVVAGAATGGASTDTATQNQAAAAQNQAAEAAAQAAEASAAAQNAAAEANAAAQQIEVQAPAAEPAAPAPAAASGSYIGNVEKHKLHKASCGNLPGEGNRAYFNTLEEASAAGYTQDNQCKKCYPYGK